MITANEENPGTTIAAPEQPAPPDVPDQPEKREPAFSFWEYFSELFIPENRIRLPLKQAHRDAAEVMEAAYVGDLPYQFVCLTMPPRTGKTKLMEALATWGEGSFTTSQIILTSYSEDKISESLAYVRKTMREPWYTEFYGDLLHGETADHLSTIDGGNIYASGVFGGLLGRGAGLKEPAGGFIGMDDPAKAEQVLSQNQAKKLEMWFETTLITRRNSDRWCPIIVIAQRLGLTDIVEYLKRTYPKETLVMKYPCFSPEKKSYFPETYADERYGQLEKTRIGRFVLAAVMQQEPVSLGGNLIPVDKFQRYAPADRNVEWEEKILVCDTALKKGMENDWWVIQCWGRKNGKVYLLDSIRGQYTSPEFTRISAGFYVKHTTIQPNSPASRFVIEEAAAGPGIIQALNELGVPATGIVRVKDKAQRVNDVLPFIETGMVLLPRDDDPDAVSWLPDFLAEAGAFTQAMTHEHDDQVDCLADGISQLLGEGVSILQALGIR